MTEANRGRGRGGRERGRGRMVDPENDPNQRHRDPKDIEIEEQRQRIEELERRLALAENGDPIEEEEESDSVAEEEEGDDNPMWNRGRNQGFRPRGQSTPTFGAMGRRIREVEHLLAKRMGSKRGHTVAEHDVDREARRNQQLRREVIRDSRHSFVLDENPDSVETENQVIWDKYPDEETKCYVNWDETGCHVTWDRYPDEDFDLVEEENCVVWDNEDEGFVEVKEYGVLDTVKSMSWCGENLCLGIKIEYVILNASNGVVTEVFPLGRIAPPLVVSLSSGEFLLGKDNSGVFVDQNGKLLQEGRICWSEAPTAVIVEKPYVIGLLPRHVEIRSLRDPYPLIQTVVLRNVRRRCRSAHTIIVELENSVYGFFLVPLGAQIVQPTTSSNFEEALALCKLLPPEESNLRAAEEQSSHIRYAHHLFEHGSYEEAMDQFVASQVEITYVLSLYPSIILPKSSLIPESENYVDTSGDMLLDLSGGSLDMSDDLEPSPLPHALESEESADLESKKMSHDTLMALIKFLQKQRYGIVEKATAEGTEEAVSDVVGNKGRASMPISSVARAMAAILDTALLQALMLTGQPSAALELLKGLNYCNVKICEEFLLEKNQYLCLLELYKCNGMHREAELIVLSDEDIQDSRTNLFLAGEYDAVGIG